MHFPIVLTLLFVAVGVYSFHVKTDFKNDCDWQAWKLEHGCSYPDDGEEKIRYMIWQDNVRLINEHNKLGKSYTLALNKFADLTAAEYQEMNGFKLANRTITPKPSKFMPPCNIALPDEVDWRKNGYVTPVKNQGQCGSCWAFSTTGSLEGQMFKKTGKLVSLSEQQLLDCSTSFGNHGCNGGLMDQAFEYIKENGGLDTEASYCYEMAQGQCRYKQADAFGCVTGYQDITEGNEQELQQALATQGPVSVAIDASHSSFQFYKQGVYDEPACNSFQLDHGVLAVGYGTENGQDYWLVKNSWGTGWGDQGYIKMSRNCNNQCGIASCASYPLV
jgi:cathepsin L